MHKISNIIDFLEASSIHKDNGVVSCDESIAYTKKWMAEHNYDLENVPAKQVVEEALADPTMPPGFRRGVELYLREYRAILYVLGRQGLEDAGEWKVTWTDEEGENHVEFFTSENDAVDFIRENATPDDLDALWTVKTQETKFDSELQKEVTVTKALRLEEIKNYPKRFTFTVTNQHDDYSVECKRDEVEEHVQNAIKSAIRTRANIYTLRKRVKPVGDELWGNWWKRVRVKSI